MSVIAKDSSVAGCPLHNWAAAAGCAAASAVTAAFLMTCTAIIAAQATAIAALRIIRAMRARASGVRLRYVVGCAAVLAMRNHQDLGFLQTALGSVAIAV